MTKIFVLTGAGISKESGIPTFRDSKDGLWHNYNIEEVASPKGWKKDPEMVLNFYNERRDAIKDCSPNDGHIYLAKLQEYFDVTIFTQNIDDLHEKAGSKKVYHIHGEITKARCSMDDCDGGFKDGSGKLGIGYTPLHMGFLCEKHHQLRPDVVFFDEFIQYEQEAEESAKLCDYAIAVGTSLCVFPAAGFPRHRRKGVPFYIVDPITYQDYINPYYDNPIQIKKSASEGMKELYEILLKEI